MIHMIQELFGQTLRPAGRDARARGDLAIPSGQYRRVTHLRASSPLVRAAAMAAAASAEPDAWRLARALCAGACLRLDRPGVAEQPLGFQSDGLAVAGCAWRVVDHPGQQGPAVGEVTRGACPCSPLSALQPDHRTELAHQAAGNTDPANAGTSALPIGQIESRPRATAAFPGHSRFDGMVGSSQLASAEDARDARRDPLRPELATYLLPWRFAGSR